MRYRNKRMGTIAEPSAEVEALNFAHNSDWEEVKEAFDSPSPDEMQIPENKTEEFEDEKQAPENEAETPEAEGEEETLCSPSEQTATSTLNMQTDTLTNDTEKEAKTETDGKPSEKKKGKASTKPPVKN